jgi:hypothetical protein
MEGKNISEAKLAWILWQRMQQLCDLLWDRYDKEFIDFPIEDDLTDSNNDIP